MASASLPRASMRVSMQAGLRFSDWKLLCGLKFSSERNWLDK